MVNIPIATIKLLHIGFPKNNPESCKRIEVKTNAMCWISEPTYFDTSLVFFDIPLWFIIDIKSTRCQITPTTYWEYAAVSWVVYLWIIVYETRRDALLVRRLKFYCENHVSVWKNKCEQTQSVGQMEQTTNVRNIIIYLFYEGRRVKICGCSRYNVFA